MPYQDIKMRPEKAADKARQREAKELEQSRRTSFALAGGLGPFLDQIEVFACEGSLTYEQAQGEIRWGRAHAERLAAIAQRDADERRRSEEAAAESHAKASNADRVYSACDAAWRQAGAPTHEPSGCFGGLAELLALPAGDVIELPRRYDAPSEVLTWVTENDAPAITDEMRAFAESWELSYERLDRNWSLVVDTGRAVPPGLKGARLKLWATEWRDSVPGLRGAEMGVYVVPGQHPVFVTWWPEPVTNGAADQWCKRLDRPHADGEQRFEPIREHSAFNDGRYRFPWHVPCAPIHLPAEAASEAQLGASAILAALPTARLLTGWQALDSLFRGKPGIPMGGRTLFAGGQKAGKSAAAINTAREAIGQGFAVAWYARDEPIGDVTLRRLQQLGLSPEQALEPSAADFARLDAQPFLICDDGYLEDFWERAHSWAAGRPLVMVADSLQTVPSAAAEGRGERDGLEAMIGAVIDCQKKWPAIFIATSEITGDKRTPKGSGRIGYSFTTLLDVRRDGNRITVSVGPSRHNGEGRFDLVLDANGQRLDDPETAARLTADAELWGRLRAELLRLGSASQRELERLLGGKAAAVRACIKLHVERDELRRVGQKLLLT